MGTFLAASAFRDTTPDALATAVTQVASDFGLSPSVPAEGSAEDQVSLFPPAGGWTVVVWPEEFHLHDIAICAAVTAVTGGTASSVHLYDDDYWTHAVVTGGTVQDVFCSMPSYFDDDPALTTRYAGRPAVVAAALGTDADLVARYLRPAEDADGETAVDGDRFELDNPWVFTDLWARLGISYPDDLDAPAVVLDLGEDWSTTLPDNPTEV